LIISLGKHVVCGALKLLKRLTRFGRRFVPERGVRPDLVVVVPSKRQFSAGVI
jgi:hypothetical protein